jgi:predicted Zn finger-like uncharacterized protein
VAEDAIEPLVTECPSCHTRFRVTEAQLSLAGGRVRCGACLMVFTGTDYLVFDADDFFESTREEADAALDALLDELTAPDAIDDPSQEDTVAQVEAREAAEAEEAEEAAEAEEAGEAGEAALELTAVEANDPQPETPAVAQDPDPRVDESAHNHRGVGLEEIVLDAADGPASVAGVDLSAEDENEPEPSTRDDNREEHDTKPARGGAAELPVFELAELSFNPDELLAARAGTRRRTRWWVPLAITGGLLALTAQVLWYQYDVWIQDPGIRPIYEKICPIVGCGLPVLKDVTRFYSKELVVRSHPNAVDALMVDALIVNDAPFEQPFPVIELRFSALGGQLVAARRFKPGEYLAGELEGATVIRPRTPVHVTLEIADPGNEAVNYVMVFR